MICAFAENLYTIFERMNAAGLVQFLGSDRSGRVEQAAINPMLDLVQVYSDKGLTVDVVEASFGESTSQRRLTTFESGNGLAIASTSFLALVTSGTSSTTAGRWTSTKSLALCDHIGVQNECGYVSKHVS